MGDVIGTVRHERPSPAYGFHQSVAEETHSASGKSTAGSLHNAAAIFRSQRLRDLLASVEEYRRASGPDRTYWRRDARHRLAEWRRLYQRPERAAFDTAVQRSKLGRTA